MKDMDMAREIAEQVAAAGGQTYFVGGYVRDKLLNIENKNVDIEIHGITPETLISILDRLGQRTVVDAGFGSVGLKHWNLDISMPRRECENSPGKRDLTMNALMEDVLTGELLDPFGGVQDLRNGVIRHVNDGTFREDPLRVLRAARFAARFGFSVAEETVRLSETLDLAALPAERVFGELRKALLRSERPSVFFRTLRRMGQLSVWFPEVEALTGVEQDRIHHPEGDVWNHTMAVLDAAAGLRRQAAQPLGFLLAALCHDFGKVSATQVMDGRVRALGHEAAGVPLAEAFLGRLTNEGRLLSYVRNMVELHMRPNLMAAQGSGAKSMCALFDRSVCPEDLLLLAKADHFGKGNAGSYEETEGFLRERLALFHHRMARPHVTGADLVQAGFQPGRAFDEALRHAHKLRLAGVEKESALKQTVGYLRKLTKGESGQ